MLVKFELIINDEIVRTVPFHKGLNIITNNPNIGFSGNSVGKSTLSRIIDYLFLAGIEPIYIDDEFNKPNIEIEKLIEQNSIVVSLTYSSFDSNIYTISRNLSKEKEAQFFVINREKVDLKAYSEHVLKTVFGNEGERPSIRYIAPKFIRNNNHRMLNTTKFLDNRTSSKEYTELFLFLFNFSKPELLSEKRKQDNLVRKNKKQKESINAIISQNKTKSKLEQLKKDSKKLQEDLYYSGFKKALESKASSLTQLQKEEAYYTNKMFTVNRKLQNINSTIEKLSSNQSVYLLDELKIIYEYAKINVDKILSNFENVLELHDKLVQKKINYLSSGLPDMVHEKRDILSNLDRVLQKKADIYNSVEKKQQDEIHQVIVAISDIKQEIGKCEGLLEQQKQSNNEWNLEKSKLSIIIQKIDVFLSDVHSFSSEFNKQFKKITKQIHGEEYLFDFDYDLDKGSCLLDIVNNAPNPEGGKKKAEIMAFDMSYIEAVAKNNINRPRFVFFDSVEDVDVKQLKTIFGIAKKIEGQVIISILCSVLDEQAKKEISKKIILELSEEDKFFGIP